MTQSHPISLREYRQFIREHYAPHHPELFHLTPGIFTPGFREAVRTGTPQALRGILQPHGPEVFSFEMLNEDFCRKLIEETDWFGEWCVENGLFKHVPNTMNNYGAVLDDFGFSPFLQRLMKEYLLPFTRLLYPDVGGDALDDHHGFVVDYEIGKDEKLDFHVDQSEVTLNVCLGKDFVGGELYFGGIRCAVHQQTAPRTEEEYTVEHHPGQALLHRGKHRHAARHITHGRRMNLILWCMSTTYHNQYDSQRCTSWCGWQDTGTNEM